MLVGLALLPACVGAGRTLLRMLEAGGDASTVWVAMLSGAACWGVIYALLPRPMWLYVFGHELTHVLWAWLFGGRVRRFRATARGGQVTVSRSNCLIVLAPYFFPLYAVLVLAGFGLGHLLWDWGRYRVWCHLLLGAAYAFHVTLTWQALQTEQTDITSQGWLFSAVVIFLGNVLVLLLGIPLVTGRVGVLTALGWWLSDTGQVLRRLAALL